MPEIQRRTPQTKQAVKKTRVGYCALTSSGPWCIAREAAHRSAPGGGAGIGLHQPTGTRMDAKGLRLPRSDIAQPLYVQNWYFLDTYMAGCGGGRAREFLGAFCRK